MLEGDTKSYLKRLFSERYHVNSLTNFRLVFANSMAKRRTTGTPSLAAVLQVNKFVKFKNTLILRKLLFYTR